MPNKAEKLLHQTVNCDRGALNESRYITSMHGEVQITEQINNLVKLALQKYFKNK